MGKVVVFILLLFVIFSFGSVQAVVTINDIINLGNELKEEKKQSGSPYSSMDLTTYALETDRFEECLHLLKRDGCSVNYYKSVLQEPNTIEIETNVFFTAIRKKNAVILNELLNNYGEYSHRHERHIVKYGCSYEDCCNLLGLALLTEYVDYDVIKVILEHKFKPDERGYKNPQDERFKKVSKLTTIQQALSFDNIEIVRILLQHFAKHSGLLRHYIVSQNLEGVKMVMICEKITWEHIELAINYNNNPESEEIFSLLIERYDLQGNY